MKRKLRKIIILVLAILALMYGEYRYIMLNLEPYRGENGTVYIGIFGQFDEYYADLWGTGY